MSYKIRLEMFEGPLDLLLYLVKKDHLNIYDIPIAKVTEQYLEYINLMQLLDLEIVGDFLVMAATLMQIKSKMLLPASETPQEEEQEDPRAELVKRLLEYEKFKQIAENLREREISQQDVFRRPKAEAPPETRDEEKAQGDKYFEASIFDLINAFSQALKDVPKEVFYEVIKDQFTVEQKVHDILHLLLVETEIKLSSLFGKAKDRLEIIVIFLAILELTKMKEITARQNAAFEEIIITRNKDNIIPYDRRDQENPA
ncbi:MAG: segregation/condensation protein A [Candidatus Omnitrophica bacterium]|nr:segregation/condensation protein A [Candidatus Omnitrophota bacterium]MDD5770791.1 segregation/condensation protein A [Candidatus Omnitrophota bacterium]